MSQIYVACCLAACIALGWLWWRSYAVADVLYAAHGGSGQLFVRGVGIYRGGILWGVVEYPQSFIGLSESAGVRHNRYELTGRSPFTIEVTTSRGMLGFGRATGLIHVAGGPLALLLRPRPYAVSHLPIWSLLVMFAALLLLRWQRPRPPPAMAADDDDALGEIALQAG